MVLTEVLLRDVGEVLEVVGPVVPALVVGHVGALQVRPVHVADVLQDQGIEN